MNGQSRDSGNAAPTGAGGRSFVRRVLIVVGVTLVAAMLIVMFWFSVRAWLLLFAGVLLAIILRGLSQRVMRWTHLPSTVALILVIVLLGTSCSLIGWLMAPSVSDQFQQLSYEVPKAFQHVKHEIEQRQLDRFVPDNVGAPGASIQSNPVLTGIKSIFSTTFEVVSGLLVILFTGIYIAANPGLYIESLVQLFPIARRHRARTVIHEVVHTLRYWILGQLLSMTVVGVLIGLGLHFLGIPLALALGILAGLLDCIPIAGPLISAAPTVLLAFVVSPLHALYVVALYVVVIAVIESHVVLPIVQRFAVALPQVVTIIALVVMWMLFGFLGVLLATPTAAVGFVLVRMVYVEDVLGDRAAA